MVTMRCAGNANISDMAAPFDHADSDGLLRAFRRTYVFRRAGGDVECSSGVNGRPRHGGTRWHESDLELRAGRHSEQYSPRRRIRSAKQRATPFEEEESL